MTLPQAIQAGHRRGAVTDNVTETDYCVDGFFLFGGVEHGVEWMDFAMDVAEYERAHV